MNYPDFNTGDILLLSCTKWYYPFSRLIEYFTDSPFSHCGIVIKDPMFLDKPKKGLFFLESGNEPFNDVENHRRKFGVELVSLEEMISSYPGHIYYRKLNCDRNQQFYTILENCHNKIHNIPYDLNPIDWCKALFNIQLGDNQHTNRFWCSALVAYLYVQWGFLPDNNPWSLISPNQFSSTYGTHLAFQNCVLENDFLIK